MKRGDQHTIDEKFIFKVRISSVDDFFSRFLFKSWNAGDLRYHESSSTLKETMEKLLWLNKFRNSSVNSQKRVKFMLWKRARRNMISANGTNHWRLLKLELWKHQQLFWERTKNLLLCGSNVWKSTKKMFEKKTNFCLIQHFPLCWKVSQLSVEVKVAIFVCGWLWEFQLWNSTVDDDD